jgi:uncharacterized protein (DUF1697 family)
MRQVVLLRGVNLGSRNRVSMPKLREVFEAAAGITDVATYLQSGNVVVASRMQPDRLAAHCKKLIADELGLDLDIVVRTRDELAEVVKLNPLARVAKNPKRYQVSFLAKAPDPAAVERLQSLAAKTERLVVDGRELYAWHPDGVARSRLWSALAGTSLGVTATARNWTTVTNLLELADQ